MTDHLTPNSLAAPETFTKTPGYPLPAHLPPLKKRIARYVDEQGWPIWRISYTLPNGIRMMTLMGKPKRSWAQAWASRMGREHGWTKIVVGRWCGGLDFKPAPYVS